MRTARPKKFLTANDTETVFPNGDLRATPSSWSGQFEKEKTIGFFGIRSENGPGKHYLMPGYRWQFVKERD
jgi:hypothetical protein